METCTVETGLLKKKPCGKAAVTRCVNCEQALCGQHAVAEVTEAGKKTGKFLCKQCHAARREYRKSMGSMPQSAPSPAKKPDEPAKAAPPKEAPPAKETPAESKPADKKDDGSIDFTPSKK